MRGGGNVTSAPSAERMQAEAARGGDLVARGGRDNNPMQTVRFTCSRCNRDFGMSACRERLRALVKGSICVNWVWVGLSLVCSARAAPASFPLRSRSENLKLGTYEG